MEFTGDCVMMIAQIYLFNEETWIAYKIILKTSSNNLNF